uniref:RAB31, member RAS onco family n=1 Tax=Equus caballus TaxID=9796 RepID=A0A9L0RM27_HORSE
PTAAGPRNSSGGGPARGRPRGRGGDWGPPARRGRGPGGCSAPARPDPEHMMAIRELKVCLLGDTGVGKSSIVCRFVQDHFDHNISPTIGQRPHAAA